MQMPCQKKRQGGFQTGLVEEEENKWPNWYYCICVCGRKNIFWHPKRESHPFLHPPLLTPEPHLLHTNPFSLSLCILCALH